MMLLNEFSADSNVMGLKFESGLISFIYEDYDSDKTYQISTKSHTFFSEVSELQGTARIELLKIADYLSLDEKSSIYILNADFIEQIKAIRKNMNLAVGLKSTEAKYILRVIGDSIFVAVPILSEKDVYITSLS